MNEIWIVHHGRYEGDLDGAYVYCGRSKSHDNVLGNPFRIGVDGDRDEVIRKFKVWVWNEYQKKGGLYHKLNMIVKMFEDRNLILGCWCSPLRCHCEVIRDFILYLSR